MAKSPLVAVRGNTYPVRAKLAAMGARWDAAEKAWMVPADKAEAAFALVGGGGRGGNGGNGGGAAFTNFVPTPEQAALRDFVMGSEGNLFCEAGAGAGKTTTSLWLIGLLAARAAGALRIAFVAFNADVKTDIAEKAPGGVEVLTMNALGFRACCRAWNVSAKSVDCSNDHLIAVWRDVLGHDVVKANYAFYAKCSKLVDLAKGALVDTSASDATEALSVLAADFELDLNGEERAALALVIDTMNAQANDTTLRTSMSFTDQMWLPVVQGLGLPLYDVLVIDEAQDTNALQLEMLSRCVAPAGRVIAVGDRRQAIYGFRGADSRAVDSIVERFGATVLPLMTTFRCAKAIVREAQAIVPQFRAGENNAEGIVRSIDVSKLLGQIQPGDFVISRTNAPLVAACLRALAAGIPAAIVGKDMTSRLSTLAKKIGKRAKDGSVGAFCAAAEEHAAREIEKLAARIPVREAAIDAIRDNVDCLLAFAENAETFDGILANIANVVRENDSTARVDFTTTHKAKGRERNRVFLFRDTFLCSRKDPKTGEWMTPSEEEFNLLYTATTRAKNELVYVNGTKRMTRRDQ